MKTRKGTADLEHVTQAKVGQTVPDVFLRSQLSLMPELKNGFAFVGLKFVSCLRSSGLHLVGQCQAQPVLRTFQQTKEKADLNQIQVGIKVEAAGIEPASRDISTLASTCVVVCLEVSLIQPLVDLLLNELAQNVF